MINPNEHKELRSSKTKHMQSIAGTFLYDSRELNSNMLTALNDIGANQANHTDYTESEYPQLMDYAATYPNVATRCYSNEMVLLVDSDAA